MTVRELKSAPNALGLYAKAVFGGFSKKGKTLPALEVVLRDQSIDLAHLAEYNRTCGFTLRDTVPSTYLHVLSTPLQMCVMTDADFPYALLGLVHVRNTIDQLRPVNVREQVTFRTRVGNLQPHDKGVTFDLVSEAFVGNEKVWIDISTYLRRQAVAKTEGAAGEKPAKAEKMTRSMPAASSIWVVPSDIGRRYGAVSGDRNPIHLYAATAKLLGFPQAIAHGMWSKAACLAALDGRLPNAYRVDVQFKLPVLLPAKVAFSSEATANGYNFSVNDARKGKPHLAGTITAL